MTTTSEVTAMQQALVFDAELIARYDQAGPRYTSYPTAVQFHDGFGADDYAGAARASNATGRSLSLYFHIPFCDTVCFYCACNKVATKDRTLAQPYLDRVYRELAMQSALFDRARVVEQLHWGGGTPTFISREQMSELMAMTRRHFRLLDDDSGEYSIEIDPREADPDSVRLLRSLGFNRMSLGVQDFDPRVQRAVNRIQTEAQTFAVLDAARANGFKSVSIDLIYGLPLQTVEGFAGTLDKIIAASPDRLSVFNYAHLPERFKPQRRIDAAQLPAPAEKLAILRMTGDKLAAAGYVYIGMDHFAKPDDELARAQRDGTLYRNFQGYSTHSNCDLVGIGITSIGMVGPTYAQNVKTLEEYYDRVDAGRLPLFKGLTLTRDDEIRRDVITRLICHFRLRFGDVERRWDIRFGDYFAAELGRLDRMVADELLRVGPEDIEVLPRGRFLIRNVCMVFDAYLRSAAVQQRFSRVI
jgi:oxygen-independent coproporphyrinogen-3 oxidase